MAGEEEGIQGALAENKSKYKDIKTGLNPEAQENAQESADLDEFVDSLKGEKIASEVDKFLFQKQAHEFQQQKETKEFTSPLTERLKGMSVKEGLDFVAEERAKGIQNSLNKINKYFIDKYKMTDESAHEFLMGEEIKGLFKGKEKKMQKEYKSLVASPAYKK